jgi:hypothetical protein
MALRYHKLQSNRDRFLICQDWCSAGTIRTGNRFPNHMTSWPPDLSDLRSEIQTSSDPDRSWRDPDQIQTRSGDRSWPDPDQIQTRSGDQIRWPDPVRSCQILSRGSQKLSESLFFVKMMKISLKRWKFHEKDEIWWLFRAPDPSPKGVQAPKKIPQEPRKSGVRPPFLGGPNPDLVGTYPSRSWFSLKSRSKRVKNTFLMVLTRNLMEKERLTPLDPDPGEGSWPPSRSEILGGVPPPDLVRSDGVTPSFSDHGRTGSCLRTEGHEVTRSEIWMTRSEVWSSCLQTEEKVSSVLFFLASDEVTSIVLIARESSRLARRVCSKIV